jgi:curved DNA-binding protein CbpA
MRDYFDLLGVPPDACAQDIRRAARRRATPSHPDVTDDGGPLPAPADLVDRRELADLAIDFVEIGPIVDRMQTAFFASGS